jgi:hypothetical protein
MHDLDRTQLEAGSLDIEPGEFEAEAFGTEPAAESGLDEIDEMELAAELLEVSDEDELDQFLGRVFKKAWKGIKKVGSAVGKVVKPLSGVLKGIAKKALPIAGGALGSMIPIPGVGTAVGSALGSAASNLLEAELEGLSDEDREFEMARRFVRLAGTAARRAIQTAPGADPQAAVVGAAKAALKRERARLGIGPASEAEFDELAQSSSLAGGAATGGEGAHGGRWIRRGNTIVILGA